MREQRFQALMRLLTTILISLLVCSSALASENRTGESGQGIFSGSFADALWTVVAFVVLLAVLGKFAWKPLLNSLKAREAHIQQQIESAESARKKAEQMLEDYKLQGLQVVQKATDQAHQLEQEVMERTRQEVLATKRKAQADVEYARVAASQQLWQEAGDMLLTLGGEVLGRTITHEDNLRLICEAINKLNQERQDVSA